MEGGGKKGGLTFMDEVPHHLHYRILRVVPSTSACMRALANPTD